MRGRRLLSKRIASVTTQLTNDVTHVVRATYVY
jgi:hypothetical protein